MFLGIAEALEAITALVKGGLGPLGNGLNFTLDFAIDFGIQIAATVILFIVVIIFFWKPITKILEQRREAIDKELEDAKTAKEDAIKVKEELDLELENARKQVKEMLDQAEKEANIRRDTIINDAKAEAKARLESLQNELELEKKNMEKDIKNQIIDIAFLAAEKIVAKEIDQEKYLSVVDSILQGGLD